MTSCKQCGVETSRPMFCSRKCSGAWRQKNVYGDKYTLRWRDASPRNFLLSLSKKKAERRDISIDYLMMIYEAQDGLCALSQKPMTYITGQGRIPTNMSIDRVNSNIGYEEGNIQLVCVQANKMKAELTTEQLAEWCEAIATNLKGKK